jgi:hypothetical protein
MDFSLTINGYLFKHLCAVIFDGLLGVVYPWFVIQATSFCASPEALNATIICGSAFAIHRYCNTQIF